MWNIFITPALVSQLIILSSTYNMSHIEASRSILIFEQSYLPELQDLFENLR